MLVLKSIDDPRDALERARLPELLAFAAANGVEIPPAFQDKAIIIRQLLRQRGLTRIKVPPRVLGKPYANETVAPDAPANTVDAAADLMRQVMAAPPPEPVKAGKMPVIVELRKECKARGISFTKTDKAADLRAKLNGKQDAA